MDHDWQKQFHRESHVHGHEHGQNDWRPVRAGPGEPEVDCRGPDKEVTAPENDPRRVHGRALEDSVTSPQTNDQPTPEVSQVVEHLFRHEAGKMVATLT